LFVLRFSAAIAALCTLVACGPPGRGATLTSGRQDPGYTPRGPEAPIRYAPEPPTRAAQLHVSSDSAAGRCTQLLNAAKFTARRHKLDLGVLIGIMRVESRFKPTARNKRSGATGLMQIMPSTGKYFKCGDLSDAARNMECGARVLRRYIDYFKGDLTYGIAAYHSGPRAPSRAKKRGRLPKNFSYVSKVMQYRTRFLRKGCF